MDFIHLLLLFSLILSNLKEILYLGQQTFKAYKQFTLFLRHRYFNLKIILLYFFHNFWHFTQLLKKNLRRRKMLGSFNGNIRGVIIIGIGWTGTRLFFVLHFDLSFGWFEYKYLFGKFIDLNGQLFVCLL